MLKKILLALTLCLGALVPVGLAAAPAHAEPCGVEQNPTNVMGFDLGDTSGVISATLWYQRCDGFNRVNGYRVRIERTQGNGDFYEKWWLNPNVIGSWNPGTRTLPIDGPALVQQIWGEGPDAETFVSKYAPDNEKCIATHVTAERNLGNNWERTTPTICMTFR